MEKSFANKDYAECKVYANKILAAMPENTNALRAIGLSFFMEEDYQTALSYMQKSLEISSEKEFEYTYIGWCYCNMDFHAKACDAFEKALDINPLYEPALSGRAQAIIHLHGERLEKVHNLENNYKGDQNEI